MTAPAYGHDLLARIAGLCEADAEREACGFVLRVRGGLEAVVIPNAADRHHAADPAAHPRTSRTGFVMDATAQLAALRRADAEGGEVVAVWHSHVEAGAALSAQDRADAAVDGLPLLPGAEHLVFGLRAGRVTEVRRYRWDGRDLVEAELAGPWG